MTYEDKIEIEREVRIIRFVENYISELENQSETPSKSLSRHLISRKRKLRELYKKLDNDRIHRPERHYDDESGERFWTKEWFDQPFTEDEMEDYKKKHWLTIHSLYDCTGLAFTRDIEIFNIDSVNGKAVVYHFMALDV